MMMSETTDQTEIQKQGNSIFWKNTLRAIDANIISLSDDRSKIIYHTKDNKTYSFNNPEEKVRASYFAELVLDYQYPVKQIDFEVLVPRRTPQDRSDIVIYEDADCKGDPFIVVECKKDGITDAAFRQAIEQVFGNANSTKGKFAVVVAGNTKKAFDVAGFPASEREKNVIADIPVRFGKAPKYRFYAEDAEQDLKIVSRDELITALEKCHNTVWQGGKLAPTTAFDEVSKLLFCKLRDEKTTKKGKEYNFQIGTHETAEEVYERIHTIYQDAKKTDSEVFKEDIRLEPKVVYNIVQHLQALAINKIDLDTKGIAFEKFMEDFFKGKMGQFFTPRNIIHFCVDMMGITPNDRVLDPACGSGGFLLNAMDAIRRQAEEEYGRDRAYAIWHEFASKRLFGIEINDQIARVSKMNMIIHDDGHTNIISTDSLDHFKIIKKINREFKKDSFDFILTNPPFGASIKSTEKDYLDTYTLGEKKNSQKTEILFIERCIDFLRNGTEHFKNGKGRMAIVLPDGILTNSSLQYVRDLLMERCIIDAIISLPQFAFTHYGAGVKSSLAFVTRKPEQWKERDYPIFMAVAEHIGYDATGRDDPKNDLDTILAEYRKFEADKAKYRGI
jgi:type I restriction enzyme M protein